MKKSKRTAVHGRRKIMQATVKITGPSFQTINAMLNRTAYRLDAKTVIMLRNDLSESERTSIIARYRWSMKKYRSKN